MKITLRRIGNSLGVLIPRSTLERWGVGEGDALELTEKGLRPPRRGGFAHHELDELRRAMAIATVGRFTPAQIRAQILANIHMWAEQGNRARVFDEWQSIAKSEDDGALFAVMLGRDENAMRLRQSAPYVGLLSDDEVGRLHEEAAG